MGLVHTVYIWSRDLASQESSVAGNLDEAVVEMQPDQGRRHPGLPGDGLRHDGPHDLLRLRARVVVELREQAAPRVAAGGAGEEDDGEHETQQDEAAATHGSGRHGS